MKLEDQCANKVQAEKIKELGILQKSLFYHHPNFDRPVFGETWTTETGKTYKKTLVCNDKKGSSAAFTVAELGVMLPGYYESHYRTNDEVWYCGNMDNNDEKYTFYTELTEAQARAAMLIYLLENTLTTPEEVNNKLKG